MAVYGMLLLIHVLTSMLAAVEVRVWMDNHIPLHQVDTIPYTYSNTNAGLTNLY